MAVLERSNNQKIISSTVCFGILASVFVFICVLIWHASKISTVSTSVVLTAAYGPIKLFTLTKTPLQSGGYQATIQFLSGLLVYAGAGLALTTLVTLLRLNNNKTA